MQDDNLQQYYLVVNEQPMGPFSLEEILKHESLTPETLVWKPGIENWVSARSLPELNDAFRSEFKQEPDRPNFQQNPYYNSSDAYKDPYQRNHYGPETPYGENRGYENPRYGENPQYRENPHYGPSNRYGQSQGYEPNGGWKENPRNNQGYYYQNPDPYQDVNPGYRRGYRPVVRTNWLPWAIVATVVGFFCSCIGAVFGIIGIVQANRANALYARDMEREGDVANSNARIMTIIGLCLAGLGIIIAFFLSSFSYY